MTSVQMNIRMDAELKKAGDKALARAGATPTEAVRLLWGYAKEHHAESDKIAGILQTLRGDEDAANDKQDTLEKLQELRAQRKSCIEKMGGTVPEPYSPNPDQSYEDALAAQLAEDRALREQIADDALEGKKRP